MVQEGVLSPVGFLRLNSGGRLGSKVPLFARPSRKPLSELFVMKNFRHKKDKGIMK